MYRKINSKQLLAIGIIIQRNCLMQKPMLLKNVLQTDGTHI